MTQQRAGTPPAPLLRDDPHWYKDAVIYQVHVRGFFDGSGDGNGDFIGLTQKLDYIQSLGISAIWLQPFYPSPLRDDGYDIAHYQGVHPAYGTRRDFLVFLDAAHARGLRVITELVINHTSDQHPWFQAARRARPGSSTRNFYVWSDTPDKYAGVPIVFKDSEPSNWSWDPVAGAYFWHRFFHHQPDLNFDNPQVRKAVLRVMRFWLDMGVDGMRLDAVPYLVEREGTQCANLPETHAVLKEIRADLDARYRNRMLLAEANQWPSDVRSYFGEGDECHMAFHFPLMPRLYTALLQEDRHPISEVLYQTPEIPESCQWAIFLRNHDELTLEMVSDEERDYMYAAYAADPQMRVNAGIRRRLAPLMENSRPRIELLNGLLLSLPGTPVLYYGDELGMGDNVYLGDRNSVRTPMQWSADRNGGFSRADAARLYSPVIMDPVYGYQAVNVEAQERSPHSLLNWMRRMIALRQQHLTFGRGSMEMLRPLNRRIFAFIRRRESADPVLVVANLSRTVQPVSLDLAQFAGLVPVEMIGGVDLPRISTEPYFLTLAPYGFFWLLLQRDPPTTSSPHPTGPVREPEPDTTPLLAGPEWWTLLDGSIRTLIERRLPAFLRRQPWFGPHAEPLARVLIVDWATLGAGEEPVLLALARCGFADGTSADYALLLTVTPLDRGRDILRHTPESVVAEVAGARRGVMHTRLDGPAGRLLMAAIMRGARVRMRHGALAAERTVAFDTLTLPERVEDLAPAPFDIERFHSSAVLGERVMIKATRRLWPDPHPERELREALHADGRFTRLPVVAGTVRYVTAGGSATLALLDAYVPHQTDAWARALGDLDRFLDTAHAHTPPMDIPRDPAASWMASVPEIALQLCGPAVNTARILGRRVAELHAALAAPAVLDRFGHRLLDADARRALVARTQTAWRGAVRALDLASAEGAAVDAPERLLARKADVPALVDRLAAGLPDGLPLTPVHGTLDLAHLLVFEDDVHIIGIAGDARRPPDDRRRLDTPLRDLADLVRSFRTAAEVAVTLRTGLARQQTERLTNWAHAWAFWMNTAWLEGYRERAGRAPWLGRAPAEAAVVVRLCVLQQRFEEIQTVAAVRPTWLGFTARSTLEALDDLA